MLVLTGEADERVPFDYVEACSKNLRDGGVNLQFVSYPGEDHFMFFSKREDALKKIADWWRQLPANQGKAN